MNCDNCEHHTVEGKTTHYYGCKHGWKKCEECAVCSGGRAKVNDFLNGPMLCPVCHGVGRVEKGEKA